MKAFAGLLFALIIPMSAHAGWSACGTVTMLHTDASPARVYIYGITIDDLGCTAGGTPTIMIEGSQATDNAKELYATILGALMAGRQIRVNSSVCWSSYSVPIVGAIEIQ
jgi:hypothetical protein